MKTEGRERKERENGDDGVKSSNMNRGREEK
jgi:hypothetical protein